MLRLSGCESNRRGRPLWNWSLSTFAVTQQFVCNWGQTGLVIDRLNPALMTHSGSGVCIAAVRKNRVFPRFGKKPLLRPARRGILLLLRLMVADRASDRRSYQTMVAGEMSGDAANRCPFKAALGISRNACERQSHRQHCAAESCFHFNTSLRPFASQSAPSVFVPLTTAIEQYPRSAPIDKVP